MKIFTQTKHTQQMQQDAIKIASLIVQDMGIAFTKKGWFWTQYLLDREGGKYSFRDLSQYDDGKTDGCCVLREDQEIVLHIGLSPREVDTVARHELAHRMHDSERYADMNEAHFAEYDPYEFWELIATFVHSAYTDKEIRPSFIRCLEFVQVPFPF